MDRLPLKNYIGCLLGGAVGDALGAPIEFDTWEEIKSKDGEQGITNYIEFSDGHGEFTDDTQMALFTAEAMLRTLYRANSRGIWGAINTICFHCYCNWLKTQGYDKPNTKFQKSWLLQVDGIYKRRAPGNTCLAALLETEDYKPGTILNNSKGCGGVMRVAPVGLVFYNGLEFAFENGVIAAQITHGHPSGYLSAGFLAALIAALNSGISIEKAVDDCMAILKTQKNSEECLTALNKAIELSEMKEPSVENIESLGGGWVGEEALAISLYCSLYYKDNFKKGLISSINHSGDSDSTGSITGNILGLIHGEAAIPKVWAENLYLKEVVIRMAEDLYIGFEDDGTGMGSEGWFERYGT